MIFFFTIFCFSWTSTWVVISFTTEPSSCVMSTSWCCHCYRYQTPPEGLLLLGFWIAIVSGSWSGSMCKAHIDLQEPQAIAIMLHRMAFFNYLARCLPCIWITALLKLICVIRVVQFLLFFPDWPAGYWVWLTNTALLLSQHTFLSISMWKLILCPGVDCFWSGIFFLTFPILHFHFGVYQR